MTPEGSQPHPQDRPQDASNSNPASPTGSLESGTKRGQVNEKTQADSVETTNQFPEESPGEPASRAFLGYLLPTNTVAVAAVGIFAALCCVFTMFLAIPVPATGGYINIGDAAVMISALLLGPVAGALAGGIGSGLADLFLGYTAWAPVTLLVKGLEGFLVGLIADPRRARKRLRVRDPAGVLLGGFEMVLGYFLYEVALFGLGGALAELPGNFIQMGTGVAIALLVVAGTRAPLQEAFPAFFDRLYMPVSPGAA